MFLAVLLTYIKNFSDFAGRVLTLLPFKIEYDHVNTMHRLLLGNAH
jgi:hypothetical protein